MNSTAGRMEARGLIERTPAPHARHAHRDPPDRQGCDVFKRADARIAALDGSLAADLSPADLTALKEMLAPRHRRSVPGSGRRSRTVARNSGLRQPGRPRANHWHMRRGGQAPATPGLEQPAPQPWRRQTGADRQAPRRPRDQDHPHPARTREATRPQQEVRHDPGRADLPDCPGGIIRTRPTAPCGPRPASRLSPPPRRIRPPGARLCATLRRGSAHAYWAASRSLIARAGGW
jgi:hypothetical protein